MSEYSPPFTFTESIGNLLGAIGEKVGALSATARTSLDSRRRRENRISTIHSSLAIEQSTLTLEQVSDVIDGKPVLGPQQDIVEAKNAYVAYQLLPTLDPTDVDDLLTTHRVMMTNLVAEAGVFRSRNAGVYSDGKLIHAGSPAQYVPGLVQDLFQWLKRTELHPVVASSIFHYEFEFIHPFADGNGRMGRLWQTLILSRWHQFLQWVPIESMIHRRQSDYYAALNDSNSAADSARFVEFMLQVIDSALEEQSHTPTQAEPATRILWLLSENPKMTIKGLAERLELSQRQVQRYLQELQEHKKLSRQGSNRYGTWVVHQER